MRGIFAKAGLALVSAGLLAVSGANAQSKAPPTPETKTITPAQFSEMRGGTAQVDWRQGYKHGTYLVLKLKNNNTLGGRVVFTDEREGKVVIRPRDGELPVAIPFADINKAERIQLAANKGDKGGIVPANIKDGGQVSPAITGPLPPNTPEIHVVRVINGDVVTEQYYSDVLSYSEEAVLKKLAQLEREVAASREQIATLQEMLRNKEQLQTALVNQEQSTAAYLRFVNNTARNFYAVSWFYADPPLGLNYWTNNLWALGANQFMRTYPPSYFPTTYPTYPVIQRIQNEGETFSPGRAVEDMEIARRSLEKAQTELAMARGRLVYEDGRIVAVRLD